MTAFVIDPPLQASIAVTGSSSRFPVRRIYCVGRNYIEHVREMGNDERDPPIFFQKPADTVVDSGLTIPYPTITKNFHHELELVVALKSGGGDISEDKALEHVWGYGVGLDMTRRDLQDRGGKPWEVAKAFDMSCPAGPLSPVEQVGHISSGTLRLTVNGEVRQESDIDLLIWRVPEIIARLSQFFELKAGDIILTGTPHGVGPVQPGDELVGTIDGLETLKVSIGDRL